MKTLFWFKFLSVILMVILLSACSSPIGLLRSSATATPGLPLTGPNAAASTATPNSQSNSYSYGGSLTSPTQSSLSNAPVNPAPTVEPTETENSQSNNEQNGAVEPTDTPESENGQSNNEQNVATATIEPTETENSPSNNEQNNATEAPSGNETEKPTSAPENGVVNACSLVTAEDASTTLGETITGPSNQTNQSPNQTQCTYTANNKSVNVIAKTFPDDQQATNDFNAQMQAQRSNQNFATLEDLGDQAIQFANSVAFVKDQYEVSIQVTYNPDLTSQVNRDKALALAKIAEDRLP